MTATMPSGYAGRMLHVDLTTGTTRAEPLDAATLRRWVGGTGLGTKYLLEMVPRGMAWDDPATPWSSPRARWPAPRSPAPARSPASSRAR